MKMELEEIITELSMTYSFDMNVILEGDDDRKFFQSTMTGAEFVNFICAWGADNVTELVERVDSLGAGSGVAPTLGIIDRDYRIPLGKLSLSPNILLTDCRDLECMMVHSPSLNNVLAEFGSQAKIEKLGGAATISTKAVSSAAAIGRLRYHSQNANINISFQKLAIDRLINRKTLGIDEQALVPHLNSRQAIDGPQITSVVITKAHADCQQARCQLGNAYFSHPSLLCRGHDLMEILAIGFRSLFGTRTAAESTRENVESLFRLNYSSHFKSSALANAINVWLGSHSLHPRIAVM